MKKLIFTVLYVFLIFTTNILYSQTNFKPGYIIKETGDSLTGSIDYRGDLLMSTTCRFKDIENQITGFSPSEIQAFRFINGKYYISKDINGKKVFLEILIKGKLSVLYFRDDDGDHYFLKKNEEFEELPYSEGFKYIDEKEVAFKTRKHMGILNYYTQDAPSLQKQILKMKKPQYSNLIRLAKNYAKITDNGKYTLYQEELPFLRIQAEATGGIMMGNNRDDQFQTDSQYGILLHFWLPRVNEKIYFKTGVLFLGCSYNMDKDSYWAIPIQFEYIYPKGNIKPRISYGFTMFEFNGILPTLSFGTNINISKSIAFSASCDLIFSSSEFLPAIIPNGFGYCALYPGIIYKF